MSSSSQLCRQRTLAWSELRLNISLVLTVKLNFPFQSFDKFILLKWFVPLFPPALLLIMYLFVENKSFNSEWKGRAVFGLQKKQVTFRHLVRNFYKQPSSYLLYLKNRQLNVVKFLKVLKKDTLQVYNKSCFNSYQPLPVPLRLRSTMNYRRSLYSEPVFILPFVVKICGREKSERRIQG